MRRSEQLKLSFAYDWSNSNISDDALIYKVLKQGIYVDICRICAHFGIEEVERLASDLEMSAIENASLSRMMDNIKKGFARAQSS